MMSVCEICVERGVSYRRKGTGQLLCEDCFENMISDFEDNFESISAIAVGKETPYPPENPFAVRAMELRPEVLAFAEAMERRLKENDDDRGDEWKKGDPLWLFDRLEQELDEAVEMDASTDEWVDAANFLMFLWWHDGGMIDEEDKGP
jgi:hypothetical protein